MPSMKASTRAKKAYNSKQKQGLTRLEILHPVDETADPTLRLLASQGYVCRPVSPDSTPSRHQTVTGSPLGIEESPP